MSKQIKQAGKLDTVSKLKAGVLTGYVSVPADGYYIIHLRPDEKTRLYLNDSLLVSGNINPREMIILPLKKGAHSLKFLHPSPGKSDFGFYRSANGQDEWWKNPVIDLK